MISVVTVPHTGTIYTLDLLRRWGVEVERKHLENTSAPPYGNERFGPGFPNPSSDDWMAYPERLRIVATLRDPMLAVISAINRRVPDRMVSVDGWGVLADWWERQVPSVHFFPIPPTREGLVSLAEFTDIARWGFPAELIRGLVPTNTSADQTGLREVYRKLGCDLGGPAFVCAGMPTFRRALNQLQEMPAVEVLFADHGFELPWFQGEP